MFYHTSIDGGKNRVNYHDCLPTDPRVFIVGHRIRRLSCKFINKGISAAEAKTILFLGNSLTAGYGLDKRQAFPAHR